MRIDLRIAEAYLAGPQLDREQATKSSVFAKALEFTLKHEGGINAHPADRGNRGGHKTNYGITQRTYNHWRKSQGLYLKNTTDLTQDEAREIYYNMYWQESQSDLLPSPLAIAHFDTAVNAGPGRAIKILQEALGVTSDGIIGVKTKKALLRADKKKLLDSYLHLREEYHKDIAKHDKNHLFLRGWLNRVRDLRSYTR